ncbi:MAG: archaemetzincin family Zn-dependent metalloprotease [Proteobacteria bacterium]|nr:archaemetzincin family Zn-dependent metalloprotease [Pseudomonadota bacterium]
MTDPPTNRIVIFAASGLESEILARLSLEIDRIFDCRTEIIPLPDDLTYALDPVRNQYHSTTILDRLTRLTPRHAVKALAIVEVDLFIPILTYVYGEAQVGGKTCIVSTYRLAEGVSLGSEAYLQRVAKEAIHELGYTFNLRHCRDKPCIMHYCRTLSDVDRRSGQLCRYCRVFLKDEMKKLQKFT